MTGTVTAQLASPARSEADKWISRAAIVTVAGLAGLAAAISYSHMRQLAQDHGQAGWHAHAFPLSVDGIEIVASLVLLADRRGGRNSGWLPWAALAIGTIGSIAANVATAGPGTVSRVIAGWPAFALLIAVKLLSGIFDHEGSGRPPAATQASPAVPLADLVAAGRTARDDLERAGRPITRDNLAARLRASGYAVSNARLTRLLQALRSGVPPADTATGASRGAPTVPRSTPDQPGKAGAIFRIPAASEGSGSRGTGSIRSAAHDHTAPKADYRAGP